MKTYNPLTDKPALRDLAPEGFIYGGFDDGFFFYQKEIANWKEKVSDTHSIIHPVQYVVIEALPEDMTKENLALMAKLGVTRARN